MPALTHGQQASPSNAAWTFMTYVERLEPLINDLVNFKLTVKFNGATGGDNALYAAYPEYDWRKFSSNFIQKLSSFEFDKDVKPTMEFVNNPITFQINPHDNYKKLFEIITGINTILADFCQNMWLWISHEVFVQIMVKGEVGSSTMPHKINPINFENAEGNLLLANALFEFFSRRLPISRMYRDLTDSTIMRNFGGAYGNTLIGLKSLLVGLEKIMVNPKLPAILDNHWEVITEGYQIILRSAGLAEGYELLAEKIKGKEVTKKILHEFVEELRVKYSLNSEIADRLLALTPETYIGNRNF
jgi:adenylosuccinate lyase